MSDFAVELVDVSKGYGGAPVVDRVSLAIRAGEFFALLGPSGCGKTTTLRMIAGFADPDAGEIRIAGARANDVPPHRRDVNLVFQNYALFPHLTVARNVAFGLEMQRVARAEIRTRVQEALSMVRMGELGARMPGQLSGGQQQRVALARALVTRPAVVLLDEPLGALDQKLRLEMQLELRALQRRVGLTFIHVTHDQEEALALSDRLAVMHRGRVAQLGTPEEVYDRPATRFVADFLGESNFLDGDVAAWDGKSAVVNVAAAGWEGVVEGCGRELKRGDRVTLSLRPERIALEPGEGGRVAKVEEEAFTGRDTRYRVALGGQSLLVRRAGEPVAKPGETVSLEWQGEDVRIVEADPA